MAIQFARLQYVQRSKGQSACHKAAYNSRQKVNDIRRGEIYDYSSRGDSAYHAVMLPEGVSEKYKDINALWNTIEAIEKRKDAQVAKEMVLALPDDAGITLEDRIMLVRSFLQVHFVDKGIICQIDIHEPHRKGNGLTLSKREEDTEGQNWHAHVLTTTRPCSGEIFGCKASHLDVGIRYGRVVGTDKQWGCFWGDHQNQFFKDKGLALRVDPIGIVSQIHIGPMRMRGKAHYLVAENDDRLADNQRYARDERLVMQQLLQKNSVFDKESVDRFVAKHIEERDREDFVGRFWSSKELVLVGESLYTSKTVLQDEQKLIRMADRLSSRGSFVIDPRHEIDLNEEQKRVVDHVCAGPHLTCVEGKAGTGKSRVLCAIRETYEADGFIVRGMAPTNSVAADMRQNGFKQASNLHGFLFSHHHGGTPIQLSKEVWLVDEASMISNDVMGEMLTKAWQYHAKVVLVGDDQQLPSIGRGGSFKAIRTRFGAVSLDGIMRQQDDAQRAIVMQIAHGQTREALDHMKQLGLWVHYQHDYEATQGMMHAWYENYKESPRDSFLILGYTNQQVSVFNRHVHEVLQARGEVSKNDIMINTARHGFLDFSVGDSIVFRENDATLGVYNGQRGHLLGAQKDQFTVRVDDDKDIVFNPQQYTDFQHGYAGTIHSAQGLTFDHVYVLHSPQMNQNLFYVANSRHRLSCHYFSNGEEKEVYQQIARRDQKELCPEALNEAPKKWLSAAVSSLKDRMCKNHAFYKNGQRHYREEGVLITDRWEDSRIKGYRTLYREDQKAWSSLEGIDVRTTSKHRDLEPFLREQGVSQCLLLDVDHHKNRQLIGPYDRFHGLYQENRKQHSEHAMTETQLRTRLYVLEKYFSEAPQSVTDMMSSKAYAALLHNETVLKPAFLKAHDAHVTNQLLYHFEKTGEMPTEKDHHMIQQRVTNASQHTSIYQMDKMFIASLPKEDQKHIQFQKQRELERSFE